MKQIYIGTRRENLDFGADGVFPINQGEIYDDLPLEHPEVERAIRISALVEYHQPTPAASSTVADVAPEAKKNELEDLKEDDNATSTESN